MKIFKRKKIMCINILSVVKQMFVAIEMSAIGRHSVGRRTNQSVLKMNETGVAGRRFKPSKGLSLQIVNVWKAFKPSDITGLKLSPRSKMLSGGLVVKTLR